MQIVMYFLILCPILAKQYFVPNLFTRLYRQDPVKKAETEKQSNEMLEANLIERSSSVWNSPVVLVKKGLGGSQWITGS